MVGIASVIADIVGTHIFRAPGVGDGARRGARRTTRTATLDGGVAVTDLGYSDGDRDIVVKDETAEQAVVDFVRHIVEDYALVTVSTEDGSYLAVPADHKYEEGVLTLKLLITEKISE